MFSFNSSSPGIILMKHHISTRTQTFSAYADSLPEKEAHSAGASILVPKVEDTSALVGIARNLVYPTTLDHLSAAYQCI